MNLFWFTMLTKTTPMQYNYGFIMPLLQILGRWDSHVYQTYIDKADIDRQEWEEMNDVDDPVKLNLNLFGRLAE